MTTSLLPPRSTPVPKDPRRVEAGRRGGLATAAKHGADHLRAIARRGGQAVSQDRDHMSQIGLKGYLAMVDRYFDSNPAWQVEWFTAKGMAAQDPFPRNGAFKDPGPFPYPWGHACICEDGPTEGHCCPRCKGYVVPLAALGLGSEKR